ncbi:MAG: hypothetical protein IKZ34_01815 [Alphaproteobacteria bacterium]|nr:hypothetical protein [Alphaproteobacteria bacterium]
MADYVNKRVNDAQEELKKRSEKLEKIVKKAGNARKNQGFAEGVEIVSNLIRGQSELYDAMVFKAPKTALEQHRNLMLCTGSMNQTVKDGIKPTTDAIDAMLSALEEMTR